MRTGDGDRGVAVSEGGEHLGARPDGDAELARTDDLGIGIGDRRRDDDDIGAYLVDGVRLVAHVHIDAGAGELADIARGLEVRARHGVPALMQDERDTAHAGAADTYEMSAREGLRLLGGLSLILFHGLPLRQTMYLHQPLTLAQTRRMR